MSIKNKINLINIGNEIVKAIIYSEGFENGYYEAYRIKFPPIKIDSDMVNIEVNKAVKQTIYKAVCDAKIVSDRDYNYTSYSIESFTKNFFVNLEKNKHYMYMQQISPLDAAFDAAFDAAYQIIEITFPQYTTRLCVTKDMCI